MVESLDKTRVADEPVDAPNAANQPGIVDDRAAADRIETTQLEFTVNIQRSSRETA